MMLNTKYNRAPATSKKLVIDIKMGERPFNIRKMDFGFQGIRRVC
jgi:hypothetical protein